MRHLTAIIALAAAAAMAGCMPEENSCAGFTSIPADGWAYADTLNLTPGITDSTATGLLAVTVRHTNAYLYRNLWLEVSTPQADTLLTDTINVELADNYGRWHGSGVGVSYMHTDTLPTRVCLTRGRPVRVRHIMRVDTLHDIEQIGLIFIPDRQ